MNLHDHKKTATMKSFEVLGVRVDQVQIDDAIACSEAWINEREHCRYIAVTGMHGVMEARHDPAFKNILNSADLVVPDGMPLVWLGRLRGFSLPRRVYGPEFMWSFCSQTAPRGLSPLFLRWAPGRARKTRGAFSTRIPWTTGCGRIFTPFSCSHGRGG